MAYTTSELPRYKEENREKRGVTEATMKWTHCI